MHVEDLTQVRDELTEQVCSCIHIVFVVTANSRHSVMDVSACETDVTASKTVVDAVTCSKF